MDIDVFSPDELPGVMRALRTTLRPDGTLDARERLFLATYARITGSTLPADDPAPMAADQLRIAGAHARKRLVQLASLAVFLSRPVRADSVHYLTELARHLDTHDTVVDVLQALVQGRRIKARLIAMRRGLRAVLADAYRAEGPRGVLRFLGALWFRIAVNKRKLGRYKRLGLLPEGTLGREYWKFMTTEGFNFPGEPAGIPDTVAYHDISHVLAGHPATPLGEIQQGSFQGGNRREDGFFFVQMVMLQFQQGVRMTPATPPTQDLFDPEKVLWAIHRGAQCRVDMTHQWDFWPLMELPLEQARERCALLPGQCVA
ncbi:MAG: hypothetical protein QM722_05155 [Piscinibacter sp.]